MSETFRKAAAKARRKLEHRTQPWLDLLDAAEAAVADAERNARETKEAMEQLRPVWAQGFTSDSSAAQASAAALSELWWVLGVNNQTAAMARLRELVSEQNVTV